MRTPTENLISELINNNKNEHFDMEILGFSVK